MWQLFNTGSALGAAFVLGSVIGAAAMVYGTVRFLEYLLGLLSRH